MSEWPPTSKPWPGVSISFLVAVIEALTKAHGERTCARMEEMRQGLEAVEKIWIESPLVKEVPK